MRRVHASFDPGGGGVISLRRSIALIWALTGFAVAGTGRDALASCGDYVMVGGSHHGEMDQSPAGSHSVPRCSGMHCQRQAPLPPAPKPLVKAGSQESACFFSGRPPEVDRRSLLVSGPVLLSSQAVLVPPDRPPRHSL